MFKNNRLGVGMGTQISLNSLLQLDRLTKLKLDGGDAVSNEDLNTFLRELANKRNIEELHLKRCTVNAGTFDILNSFDKLQVLITFGRFLFELSPSLAWPPNLKKLRLRSFKISFSGVLAIIKKLKYLEKIDLCRTKSISM